jgi:hypothetical protein
VVSGKISNRADRGSTRENCAPIRLERIFAFTLLIAALTSIRTAQAQNFLPHDAPIADSSNARRVDGLKVDAIISNMIERNRLRSDHLQNYSALRRYEIINSHGQASAEATVRVEYRSPGKKSFQTVSEDGSWMIRRFVFDRLLQSEEETSTGQERREAEISEENYNFRLAGEENIGANHCYVVEAEPKRMDKYLFKGELWIDAQDFGIVKISGQPAAKMSIWISRAEFVREFQKIDGFWLPYRDETIVELRSHGTKLFRIEHEQYIINAMNPAALPEIGSAPHIETIP